jgi:hypothetical protein
MTRPGVRTNGGNGTRALETFAAGRFGRARSITAGVEPNDKCW